jgi:hypothetical protein
MEPIVAVRMASSLMLSLLGAGCIERALPSGAPCGKPDITTTVQIKNIDKVDVLFVIDNSSSMQDNQEKLREQLPQLVRTLLTGSGGPETPEPFGPLRDLHIAVINSDMGASGVEGCSEYGADGIFQQTSQGPACAATYPPFLSYLAVPEASVDQLASDFACIANVGADGCAREEPLEAALKALWPASDSSIQFEGEPSHGDRENAGFLRSDPRQGQSLFAVVVLSDEDDASPFPITRYIDGFNALRPGNQGLALFSAIVSVPPELVDAAARSGVDFEDALQRDAYYERILSDPRMQSELDATAETGVGSPGRRYIELAKALGPRASVTSISQRDFGPALDLVRNIVGRHLDSVCLPEEFPRNDRGTIACNVIWDLPPERLAFDTPIDCSDRPAFLTSLPGRGEAGGKRCLVQQQAANTEAPKSGEGWYYDDFSAERAGICGPGTQQRVVFTPAAVPPTGVTIVVECWSGAQAAVCE